MRGDLIVPVHESLREHARRQPDRIAFSDRRRTVSYGLLHERTGTMAGRLGALGLPFGGRAAIFLGNRVEVVESFHAILRAGGVVVPLDPALTPAEVRYQLVDSGAVVVVTDSDRLPMLTPILTDLAYLRVLLVDDGDSAPPAAAVAERITDFEDAARVPAVEPGPVDDLGLDDIAFLLYTSGTTGTPKGVLSTQRNCLWSVASGYATVLGLEAEDRMLWPLPLFHSLAHILCVLGTSAVGAHTHILDGFAADTVLEALAAAEYTVLVGVPAMYHYLLDAAAAGDAIGKGRMRVCLSTGAAAPPALRERFERVFGTALIDSYGSTETCGAITMSWPGDRPAPGSCGLPVPGLAVRIVDPRTGIALPAGTEGEVWVQGPNVMLGYHNQDEATRGVLVDGWYRTGDLAVADDNGYLSIRGRARELIIRGGENIHPGEVEAVLSGLDWVAEAAVFGRAHPVLGEVPVAAVVLGAGVDPLRFTELSANAVAACRKQLAAYKIPEQIVPVHTIPRTASGKIRRHELREAMPGTSTPAESVPASVPGDPDLAAAWSIRLRTEGVAPLRAVVATAVAAVLDDGTDLSTVDFDLSFGALGLTSVTALALRNRLVAEIGLDLPATVVYDRPTPAALLRALRAELLPAASSEKAVPVDRRSPEDRDPIAIVGMACRYPGEVSTPEHLWDLLDRGVDAVTEFPLDRGWDITALFDPAGGPGTSATGSGGFLSGVADFDPRFFGVAPREAVAMDPQQRILLELAWEAVERAGTAPDSLRETRTGVFIGSMFHDYGGAAETVDPELTGYLGIGVAGSVLSGRIAYTLGLRGPALTVDTACSSSLVALHLAVRALRSGECDAALAGGVAVMATPATFIEFTAQSGLAGDGRCKAFGASADGTGWGEGAGLLLLQRLSDARRAGRPVLAVIEGTAINSDGASNGLTAPSGPAQQEVIRAALADAGLTVDHIDAVEAHGTGTTLGDPIEASAILATYGQRRDGVPVLLGSLKSNIAHTQSAAGVGAVIKMVQALRNERLPATLHADPPSPHVRWDSGRVDLLIRARNWPRDRSRTRRAGISAFGVSGTNAHLVLGEAPDEAVHATDPGLLPGAPSLVPVTAKTSTALAAQGAALADRLAAGAVDPAAVAHTYATGRTRFPHRAYLSARTAGELAEAAAALAQGEAHPAVLVGTAAAEVDPALVFAFSGQGSQYVGMGRALAEAAPIVGDTLAEIAALADPLLPRGLLEVMWDDTDALHRTEFTQPALFAIEVAVFRLLDALGVRPAAVIGHSVGEIAAAHVAGVLSLADAVTLACARGRLMQALPEGGAMIAIEASEAELTPLLGVAGVDLAAVNGERSLVISGDEQRCAALAARFADQGRRVKRLAVSHAFHSRLMRPARDEFAEVLAGLGFHPPRLRCHPSAGAAGDYADPDYWLTHLVAPVRFADALDAAEPSATGFVEIGPGTVLTALIAARGNVAAAPLRGGTPEPQALCRALVDLELSGHPIALERVHGRRPAVDMPTYAFQRERYWLTPRHAGTDSPGQRGMRHPILGAAISVAGSTRVVLTGRIGAAAHGWLAAHRVAGAPVLPGTALVELAAAAGGELGAAEVRELVLHTPLVLDPLRATEVQVVLEGAEDGGYGVTLFSRVAGAALDAPWTRHAEGELTPARGHAEPEYMTGPPADAVELAVEGFYDARTAIGVDYGPEFRGLRAAWHAGEDIYARVDLPDPGTDDYTLHPAFLDAAMHAVDAAEPSRASRMPFAFSGVRLLAGGVRAGWVRLRPCGADAFTMAVHGEDGAPLASIEAVTLRPTAVRRAERDGLYRMAWQQAEPTTGSTATQWQTPADADVRTTLSAVVDVLRGHLDRDDGTVLLLRTTGAVRTDDGDDLPDPTQAAVWGLVRSAQAEHPGRFRVVDLPRSGSEVSTVTVALHADAPQLAVRGAKVLVPRLVRAERGATPSDWELISTAPGDLSGVVVRAGHGLDPDGPGAGQVRVRMVAAGVNFRDVLLTLGMYPGGAGLTFGGEGAGVVVATGPGVERFAPGDRVMGVFSKAFAAHADVEEYALTRIPAGVDTAVAAGLPIVALTALYGLTDLARLRAGQRILVHSAAGGVGLAAVRLARARGAEVYATAGRGKWAALRAEGIDDAHLADSRTLDFADAFPSGFDVVLAALSGPAVDASLRLLAPGGIYLDIGKTDLRQPDSVRERLGVEYRPFDLADADPQRLRTLLEEVAAMVADGRFVPLPTRAWDIGSAVTALRHLQQARQVGKVVLLAPPPARTTGTVLITGGTGGLGGLVARHLVRTRDVRDLLLVSRRGPAAPEVDELVADLRAAGAVAEVVACDLADRGAVADLVAGREIGGVVHTAGVLADGMLTSMDADRLDRVLRPKVDAVVALTDALAGHDLDFFVVFSSAAGVLGNPGQANYAAANAYLDAYAQQARGRGVPMTSIAWGLWGAEQGMNAGLSEADLRRNRRDGMRALSVEHGMDLLDQSIDRGGALVAADLDPTARDAVPDMLRALVRPAHRVPRATAGHADAASDLRGPGREGRVRRLVVEHTAAVLGLTPTQTSVDSPFKELGMDSLTAVELRNRLAAVTGVRLPSSLVFDHPTPAAVAALVLAELGEDVPDEPAPAPGHTKAPTADDPIAVVAMACRLPGGISSPEQLWDALMDRDDLIGPMPTDRGWDLDALYDPDPTVEGTSYVREGGFLHDAAYFDADFFGIGPREALTIDPQQRLLLETSWEAVERARIDPRSLRGSATGVYTGVINHDYAAGIRAGAPGPVGVQGHLLTGTAGSVASGRIAYALGLRGPALSIDTACSSSLVTLHLAAAALRAGECDLALAGGVTVMSGPRNFIEFSRQRGLSPSGRCRAFAADADGTAWAEGVGMLVLQRLSDARAAGRPVLAVLRGSAVNSDGASNGLTAPNGPAQQRVIRQALANAGLDIDDVQVVEAHGTGTALGDPIEAQALLATYGRERSGEPLLLGSVKSNVGHTQGAAGVTSVIKAVTALTRGIVPATLHVTEPSGHVDWSSGAVHPVTEHRGWPATDGPRRIGVSSFGISGTNAHLILEQADSVTVEEVVDDRWPIALPLSANGTPALAASAAALRDILAREGSPSPSTLAYSLARTRATLRDRAVIVADDAAEVLASLTALARGEQARGTRIGPPTSGSTAYLFTGQGSQRVGMGRELARRFPVFADELAAICAEADRYLPHPLAEVLWDSGDLLNRTEFTQPAIFAYEVALYRLLESADARPDAVAGHSIGEIAAAHVAGVLSRADATRMVCARGALMGALPAGGTMIAVQAAEAEVAPLVLPRADAVSIAAVNGPAAVVLSGAAGPLAEVVDDLDALLPGRRRKRLLVSHAFHSPLMDPILAEFADVAAELEYHAPTVPIFSTVTGARADDRIATPDYWVDHVGATVRFEDAVSALAADGVRVYLEIGPAAALSPLIAECHPDPAALAVATAGAHEVSAVLSALGALHTAGRDVRWSALLSPAPLIDLPTYRFQRERYWLTDPPMVAATADVAEPGSSDLLVETWVPGPPPRGAVSGRWLVVADATDPVADELVDTLRAAGGDVGRAAAEQLDSRTMGEPDTSWVALAPADSADGAQWLRAILVARLRAGPGRVWALTRGAVSVSGGDRVARPGHAQVWGFGRVVALEHPESWGGLVDIGDRVSSGVVRTVAALLADHARIGDELAVRPGGVWHRRAARRGIEADRDWTTSGTALVTGGSGALAAVLTPWLVERGARRVLLVSRSGVIPSGLPADLGGEIVPVACDITDAAASTALVEAYPDLRTVVHAAGVLADGVVVNTTAESLSAVLAPKVTGAQNLHAATVTRDLDAFVLFSSTAGFLGNPGQAAYAAANSHLDALAAQRHADGLPATAVAWGPWAKGMAEGATRAAGVGALDSAHALAALGAVLARGRDAVVAIAAVDWDAYVSGTGRSAPFLTPVLRRAAPRPETTRSEPAALIRYREAAAADRPALLSDAVSDLAGLVLGYDSGRRLDPHRGFLQQGFDSLLVVELRNRIAAAFDVAPPPTLLFDHPTPAEVAVYLREVLEPDTGPALRVEAGPPAARTRIDADIDALDLDALLALATETAASADRAPDPQEDHR